jgi:hypothetical protein
MYQVLQSYSSYGLTIAAPLQTDKVYDLTGALTFAKSKTAFAMPGRANGHSNQLLLTQTKGGTYLTLVINTKVIATSLLERNSHKVSISRVQQI